MRFRPKIKVRAFAFQIGRNLETVVAKVKLNREE